VQFFLQVREFPRAVSALHTACPYAKERRMLAESLYEEETGLVSGCGLPHSEVPGAFGPFARAVQKHYGLSRQAVSFWDVHEIADREHSDVGDHIVVHFADTAELQQKVRDAVETSLDRWVAFFDDIDASLA
jgi:pyrroloquinoline quinone (PQQ) biosynthesis protein C